MKVLLTLAMASATLSGAMAQSYTTGFDNPTQQAGWQEFRKGTTAQPEHWGYDNSQEYSSPNCLMHYYPVGGTVITDDWFVSPAFLIESGGTLDSLRYAFSGFGTPQAADGDTVFVYLLNGNADPDLASSADILFEFSGANYVTDNIWHLLAPVTLPAHPGNSYIAFRYKTINNWLDVRFDNLALSGTTLAGINEDVLLPVSVYPNPVTGNFVNVEFDAAAVNGTVTMNVFSASGQLVHTVAVSGSSTVELTLAPGYYSYQLEHASGIVAKGKLVIP